MEAKILPLEGKYYGTHVLIKDDDGNGVGEVEVWLNPVREEDYAPSERELGGWDENEFGPYDISDSHYESVLGYRVAKLLEEAVNNA